MIASAACDAHVHVIGPQPLYPMQPERAYTPEDAPRSALVAHLQTLKMGRVVVVQPSFYGVDNRCTMQAVSELNASNADSARAVVVLPEAITETELARLHAAGARGVRINLDSGGHGGKDDLAAHVRELAARVAPFGWHLQVLAQIPALTALLSTLSQLPIPVVLDHFASVNDAALDSADAGAIVRLVGSGHAYVKLSAPYRLPAPLAASARALAQANPQRILWGSDWPHTQREPMRARLEVSRFQTVDAAANLRTLAETLGDTAAVQAMLVTNPARLYGFAPAKA